MMGIKTSFVEVCPPDPEKKNFEGFQRKSRGPMVLLGLVKHKTYKTWKINGKEMTLTFNTHIPS